MNSRVLLCSFLPVTAVQIPDRTVQIQCSNREKSVTEKIKELAKLSIDLKGVLNEMQKGDAYKLLILLSINPYLFCSYLLPTRQQLLLRAFSAVLGYQHAVSESFTLFKF